LKPAEREWTESVIKKLILRVGQYGFDPNAKLPQINMSDFQVIHWWCRGIWTKLFLTF